MGNKLPSPFPAYEVAISQLTPGEREHQRRNFKALSKGSDSITISNFSQAIIPRLFHAIDTKKDNVVDFEEFLCAIALFRIGTIEDKIRVLYLMYEPNKNGTLARDQCRQLIVDSTIVVQKEDVHTLLLKDWLEDMADLAEGMVESVLYQFAHQDGKLDFQEFMTFVKVEGSVQGLLKLLPDIIDY